MLHCPNRDGLLKKYSQIGKNGLSVTYDRCPSCRGFWLTSFAANFIQHLDIEHAAPHTKHALTFTPLCPECNAPLTHARGDAIAPGVSVWRCPGGHGKVPSGTSHGYFFPTGELAKFKQAQTAKLSYHKLWNVPLASVASVLLASLALLLVSITAVVTAIRQKQIITSQAQSIFQGQRAIANPQGTVTFITSTNLPAAVTLFVEVEQFKPIVMETSDGLTHTTTVSTLPPGTYTYYFVIERNGQRSITEKFTVLLQGSTLQ